MKTLNLSQKLLQIILTFILFFLIATASFAQVESKPRSGTIVAPTQPIIVGKTLATGQTATGVSSATAFVAGAKSLGCDVAINSGTATVQMECKIGSRPWRTITGTSVTTDTLIGITIPCDTIRSEIMVCTGCNVTVYCQWAY